MKFFLVSQILICIEVEVLLLLYDGSHRIYEDKNGIRYPVPYHGAKEMGLKHNGLYSENPCCKRVHVCLCPFRA